MHVKATTYVLIESALKDRVACDNMTFDVII